MTHAYKLWLVNPELDSQGLAPYDNVQRRREYSNARSNADTSE